MDQVATEGMSKLLEFGVIAIFNVLFIACIVYLFRISMKSKDNEIESWKTQAKETREQVNEILQTLSTNMSRMIDHYDSQSEEMSKQRDLINKLPEQTVKELRASGLINNA